MKKLINLFVVLILCCSLTLAYSTTKTQIGSSKSINSVPYPKDSGSSYYNMGSGGSNCYTDYEEHGSPACYDGRNQILAWMSGFCPQLNPEFVECVNTHSDEKMNNGRDFQNAINYWGSWKPKEYTHISFRQQSEQRRIKHSS